MRREDDGRLYVGPSPVADHPAVHVADFIDQDVLETDFAEQLGDVGGAAAFGARRGRDRGQGGLPRERHLIGALEMMARRADALVREQARDALIHRFTVTRLTVPGEWATLPPWRSAS